jgi:hypothetical protein
MAQKEDLHPSYLEAEQTFRNKVLPLHEQERQLREFIRQNASMSDEERMDTYIQGYKEINQKVEDLSNEFFATTLNERSTLEQELHSAGADHLIAASSLDKDQRSELLDLALSSAQPALARALAQVARQRNEFGTFEKWATDEPDRAKALAKYRGLPDHQRLKDRVYKAVKLPKAGFEALKPTAEDQWNAEEEARADAVRKQREEFYGLPRYDGPRRQVGRKIEGGEVA